MSRLKQDSHFLQYPTLFSMQIKNTRDEIKKFIEEELCIKKPRVYPHVVLLHMDSSNNNREVVKMLLKNVDDQLGTVKRMLWELNADCVPPELEKIFLRILVKADKDLLTIVKIVEKIR